jgi:hypothetical protein
MEVQVAVEALVQGLSLACLQVGFDIRGLKNVIIFII